MRSRWIRRMEGSGLRAAQMDVVDQEHLHLLGVVLKVHVQVIAGLVTQ